jgi:hypothetical protein
VNDFAPIQKERLYKRFALKYKVETKQQQIFEAANLDWRQNTLAEPSRPSFL